MATDLAYTLDYNPLELNVFQRSIAAAAASIKSNKFGAQGYTQMALLVEFTRGAGSAVTSLNFYVNTYPNSDWFTTAAKELSGDGSSSFPTIDYQRKLHSVSDPIPAAGATEAWKMPIPIEPGNDETIEIEIETPTGLSPDDDTITVGISLLRV